MRRVRSTKPSRIGLRSRKPRYIDAIEKSRNQGWPLKQAQVEKPERSKATGTEADLLSRYLAVRDTSHRLCAPLSPEDCAVQSMP
ncbi:MAG: hypothetical protein ACREX4_15065, partial [Gammaproteobacteria bacterium]